MKHLFVVVAFVTIVPCAGAIGDPPSQVDGDAHDHVGYRMTMSEFDMVERLRENPLDPRRVDLEELLLIPDFPLELALRLIQVRERSSSRRGLLGRLTPPERETLYRYSEFLVLPERPSMRVSARLLKDRMGSKDHERTGGYISILGDGLEIVSRGRISATGRCGSLYIAGRAMSGRIRIHGGDYLPDLSMGLLFCAYFSSYPFTGGYPFRGYRWLVGRTSFYGSSIRGLAGEIWTGCARTLLFVGRPRVYGDESFYLEGELVWGGRIEFRLGDCAMGSTLSFDPSSSGGRLMAIDARWCRGDMTLGGEVACDGLYRAAGTWGLSLRRKVLDAGILFHVIPNGLGNRFGYVAGRAGGSVWSRRGINAVLRRRFKHRIEVRSAFDRSNSRSGFALQRRDIVRLEFIKSWKDMSSRVSFQSKMEDRFDVVPYPGEGSPTHSRTNNLNLLFTWNLRRGIRLRTSFRCPWGGDHAGILFSPSLYIALFNKKIRFRATCSVFRSLRGKSIFYFYEPSLKGSYPWKSVRGDGCRKALLVESISGAFNFSCHIILEPERGLEAKAQLALDL